MTRDKQLNLWIVIPTYNRAQDLLACLASVLDAGVKEEQILVIDNHSTDNTATLVGQKYPKINLKVMEDNLGAAKASNQGFDVALKGGATHVLRLDSDTVVHPGFIQPLLKKIQEDPEIGIAAPKIYYFTPPDEIWYAGDDSHPFHFGAKHGYRHQKDSPMTNQPRMVDYAWGAAMLITREVLEQTNGFDLDFFIYYEEIDFCLRVKELGFKIFFVPKSIVWHKVGSTAHNAWTGYHWNRSKMLLFRKHARNIFHLSALIVYECFYSLIDALRYQLKLKKHSGNRGPLPSVIKGFWSGLTVKISSDEDKNDIA